MRTGEGADKFFVDSVQMTEKLLFLQERETSRALRSKMHTL